MLKKLFLPFFLPLATSAFATETHGEGMARDAAGRSAHFMLQAAVTATGITGSFNMNFIAPTPSTTGPQIRIPAVTALRVVGNHAQLSGRGFIRYQLNTGGFRDIPAFIMVDVWDNASPSGAGGIRDRIRVAAIAPLSNAGMAGRFDGLVTQGDIIVTP